MGWGYAGGNGKGASDVAARFFSGKPLTRGNYKTDGETFWLFGHAIAKRCEDTRTITERVASTLLQEWHRPEFEFSWAGYDTATTCNALNTLGVRASRSGGVTRVDGHIVNCSAWYTRKDLESLPTETDDEIRKRLWREMRDANRAERERIHAMTADMFA